MRSFVALLTLPLALAACASPVPFLDRHANGAKKSEGALVRSVQEGEWTHYWPNGRAKAKGEYRNDIQVGPWTWWYENGTKRTAGAYRDEHSVGFWQYWHPNGKPHMAGWFDAGRKTGEWSVFDASGRLSERGQYANGKRTSLWVFVHPSGKKKAEGWFFEGAMVGAWQFFDASGVPSQAQHGMPKGVELVVERWGDGRPRRAGFVMNDAPIGRWVTWHDTGALRLSGDFANGHPAGTWRAFAPNGELLAIGPVDRSQPSGEWQVARAGKLVKQAIDARGRPPGVWSGVWSRADEFDVTAELVAVERWLLEAVSPRNAADIVVPPSAKPSESPDQKLVQEIVAVPKQPVPQPFLTQREIRGLSTWLRAYTSELLTDAFAFYEPGARRKDKSSSARLTGLDMATMQFQRASGELVGLQTKGAEQWTLLVILRGFAGQVCPYCPMQIRALAPFRKQIHELGVRVMVIYPGPKSGVDGFRRAYKDTFGADQEPPYGILYDEDSRAPRALGILDESTSSTVLARPTTLLLDGHARVRYAYVGRHRADRPGAESLIEKIRELRKR